MGRVEALSSRSCRSSSLISLDESSKELIGTDVFLDARATSSSLTEQLIGIDIFLDPKSASRYVEIVNPFSPLCLNKPTRHQNQCSTPHPVSAAFAYYSSKEVIDTPALQS